MLFSKLFHLIFATSHDHICSFGNITKVITVYKNTRSRVGSEQSITNSIPDRCSILNYRGT